MPCGYDIQVLLAKPGDNGWSLGQVYMHLLNDTNIFIGQIENYLSHNAKQSGGDDFSVVGFTEERKNNLL